MLVGISTQHVLPSVLFCLILASEYTPPTPPCLGLDMKKRGVSTSLFSVYAWLIYPCRSVRRLHLRRISFVVGGRHRPPTFTSNGFRHSSFTLALIDISRCPSLPRWVSKQVLQQYLKSKPLLFLFFSNIIFLNARQRE